MEIIEGAIDIFIFHNEENSYSIIKLEDGVIAVGLIPYLNSGETVRFKGDWVKHPKYGSQFKFTHFEILQPKTVHEIVSYLSSNLIEGIGEVYAKRIVTKFGDKTLEIFDENIDRLLEIEGIGKKKLAKIKKSWEAQKGIKDIMMFLQNQNISTSMSIKIYKSYGEATIDIITQDPYRLVKDIWGIGFKTVEEIGRSLGIEENDPRRIKAGLNYLMLQATLNGHTYLPKEELINSCYEVLSYQLSYDDKILTNLEKLNELIIVDNKVYLPYLYFAERSIEKKILRMTETHSGIDKKQLRNLRIENSKYSDEQLSAIRLSLEKKILIITGGPGTGKTTTLKGIIDIYQKLDKKILLAAPTGKAAKRMSQLTKMEAKTIHRMLEFNPLTEEFNYNEETPLEAELIIIDEVSMIDTILMFNLLKGINTSTTLVFVGDADQLPSVGAGNILVDLIKSEKISIITLNKIFRQAEESQIVVAAHQINRGVIPNIINKNNSDLFFIEENFSENIPELIFDLCSKRLPANYDINPLTDLQIISPMYKGNCGVNNLNLLFQNNFNNNPVLLNRGNKTFKFNDKVMQLNNNYEKEIYNGDLGFVKTVDTNSQRMIIEFSGRPVKYDFADLDELTLAYALTVHKSQGSEYPFVIMPLITNHFIMLQRNLLYTAITRASEMIIIIGSKKALSLAVNNNRVRHRYTSLFHD